MPALLLFALSYPAWAQFGKVVGWGDNSSGQARPVTYYPANVAEVAAGDDYSMVRGTDGTISAWGNGGTGQTSPPFVSNAVALAAGSSHGLALLTDGTVVGWGNNFSGQASAPPGLSNVTQISAGDDHNLALLADGSVTGWGNVANGQITPPVFTAVVMKIAAGKGHSLALLNNGTVVGWGNNFNGQANPPPVATSVVEIAGGRNFSLARRTDGTVVGWGDNFYNQIIAPANLTNAAKIAAGGSHGVALRTDGTVVCWGNNSFGQTNVPPGLSNVVAIAAGENHTIALKNDGAIVGWGKNTAGQIMAPRLVGPDVLAIDAGGDFALAMRLDGHLTGWGATDSGQANPPGNATNIASFSAGYNHGLAVDSNFFDFGWGNNSFSKNLPPVFLTNVVKVSAGRDHSLVLRADGRVYAFGDDTYLQVFDTPTSLTNVIDISAGGWFNVALLSDNTVTGWGQNFSGQCTPPAGLTGVVKIEAGRDHVLALRNDGTVVAWGDNAYGQTNVPSGLTNVIAIAAGAEHSMALLGNRKVIAWGNGVFGQTNVPTNLSNVFAIAAGDDFSLALEAFPVEINAQPASTTVLAGTSAQFNVGVVGSPPFGFQWRLNGTNIAGGTSQSYVIGSAAAQNVGVYDVVVSNLCGAVTSATASLSLAGGGNPPFIVTQPASLSLYSGSLATFTSGATGDPPIFFQWKHNGTNLPGATATNFQIASVAAGDAGSYAMVASNAFGMVTSFAASLLVDDPAHITAHPTNITVSAGAAAQFEVMAAGAGILMFQWRKDGTNLSGQTSPFLSFTGVTLSDAGNYDAVVSNNLASVTSSVGVLTVQSAPALVAGPSNATVVAGNAFALNVVVAGTPPLHYLWRLGGSPIAGATNAGYGQASAAPADAGTYDVIISNAFGAITSGTASVTVLVPPVVTDPPDALTVTAGNAASFAVAATGTAPIVYQWRRNGSPIGGATATNFSIGSTVPGDEGSYDVLVSNVAGIVTSAAATLTVQVGPVFTVNPAGTTIVAGASATFSATATGSVPLVYQWRKGGAPLSGMTASSLTITNALPGDAGTYDVLASNVVGVVTSGPATLVVLVLPTITSNPVNQTVLAGNSATFGVAATGTLPIAFQWLKNGTPLAGETTFMLTVPGLPGDAGSYAATISNAAGIVTSAIATLTVQVPPVITVNPTGTSVNAGNGVVFNAAATGTTPLAFQWLHDGTPVGGATSPAFSIAATVPADAGNYAMLASNVVGLVTSLTATLTIITPPTIVSNPSSQTIVAGAGVTFGVAATGTIPFAYQWRKDGTNLAGQVSASYGITGASDTDAGVYDVLVSNAIAVITSAPAVLVVQGRPVIVAGPSNLVSALGGTVTFSVTATGAAPIVYQWRHDGAVIVGATGSNYTIASVSATDTGAYDVIVSNLAGSVTSGAGILSIAPLPVITSQPTNLTVFAGDPAQFNVGVAAGAVTFQWLRNGATITGATGQNFFLASAQPFDAGRYNVVVANAAGSVTSAPATLTVLVRPTIVVQPRSRATWLGAPAHFGVVAAGTPPLFYQWQFNGADLPGATSQSLFIADAQLTNTGSYRVVVSNNLGTAISQVARLEVRSTTASRSRNDFDGDGRSDLGVFVPVTGNWQVTVWRNGQFVQVPARRAPKLRGWRVLQSAGGFLNVDYGWMSDTPATGDYDGDGVTDPCVFRPKSGTWYFLNSSNQVPTSQDWGWSGSRAAPGDFDGDGATDLSVYDTETGDWYILQSTNGQMRQFNWGSEATDPVPADFDGDGTTDAAVYDRETGDWFVMGSISNGAMRQWNWGWPAAVPVHGDYDGDGLTEPAVYDPATGTWYIRQSSNGELRQQQWGWAGLTPVPGDYDGDTLTDIAGYDQASGTWYILQSTDGQMLGGGPIPFGYGEAPPMLP